MITLHIKLHCDIIIEAVLQYQIAKIASKIWPQFLQLLITGALFVIKHILVYICQETCLYVTLQLHMDFLFLRNLNQKDLENNTST